MNTPSYYDVALKTGLTIVVTGSTADLTVSHT